MEVSLKGRRHLVYTVRTRCQWLCLVRQQQLLQEQVDALAQTNKQQELLLKQVFVTEQLVKQLQLDGTLLNEF